ncbi:MAG: phosphoribosyltransferase [Proteobacteria bacterium]|nr:phosphoribosyltransferase [Pseudomonadota bacterium]
MRFRNRVHAGELLAERLTQKLADEWSETTDGVVLGLPRGGVPVAAMVARKLDLPLDVHLVRKLGVPGREEYAMGAISSGGIRILNDDAIEKLGISDATIENVTARERIELERRERLFRGEKPPLQLDDRTVIIVDDGIATGASMISAIRSIRGQNPQAIIVAIPVAPRSTVVALEPMVDLVVVLATPEPFSAVGLHYVDFAQTSDAEVQRYLASPHDPSRSS